MKTIVKHLLATVAICAFASLMHRLPHPPPFDWAEYLVTSGTLSAGLLAVAFLLSLFNKIQQRKYMFLHMVRHLLVVMVVVLVLGDWVVPVFQVFDSYSLYFSIELLLSVLVLFWIFDSTAELMFPRVKRMIIHSISATVILMFLFLEFRHQLLPSSQYVEEMPETLALIEPLLPFSFSAVAPEAYFATLQTNVDAIQKEIAEDIKVPADEEQPGED